jgi:hypothetical protein
MKASEWIELTVAKDPQTILGGVTRSNNKAVVFFRSEARVFSIPLSKVRGNTQFLSRFTLAERQKLLQWADQDLR